MAFLPLQTMRRGGALLALLLSLGLLLHSPTAAVRPSGQALDASQHTADGWQRVPQYIGGDGDLAAAAATAAQRRTMLQGKWAG